LTTAEPGFQIDCGENAGEHMRNACTEVTSHDDSDICNLGSINLANVETKEEFEELVLLGTAFLLAGSIESTVPHESIRAVREKNRRLGLGLMGIYEWLVKRGYSYDPNEELASWLDQYAKSTEIAAVLADRLGVSRPVKTRAIAPTGTIAIIAETTSGIEPLFAGAYKRRYLADGNWKYQYVIDATAQRLMDQGVDFHSMETAYELAKQPERRIAFQAWLQHYVDMGISSTLNLPAADQQNFTHAEFGDMLIKYLPHLRGVTAYPDGARGGQPLNVVPLEEALGWEGVEFEEFGSENACVSGVCGI
jgi:ribonucleoside-diphosphate reductase alpha chain